MVTIKNQQGNKHSETRLQPNRLHNNKQELQTKLERCTIIRGDGNFQRSPTRNTHIRRQLDEDVQ